MTNAELIEELERVRVAVRLAECALAVADKAGADIDALERDYLELEEDLQQLSNEVEYRLNWEPRPRAW